MGSFLYDPINMLTLDAQITSYGSSERELLYKHLENVDIRLNGWKVMMTPYEVCVVNKRGEKLTF